MFATRDTQGGNKDEIHHYFMILKLLHLLRGSNFSVINPSEGIVKSLLHRHKLINETSMILNAKPTPPKVCPSLSQAVLELRPAELWDGTGGDERT